MTCENRSLRNESLLKRVFGKMTHFRSGPYSKWPIMPFSKVINFRSDQFLSDRFRSDKFSKWSIPKWAIIPSNKFSRRPIFKWSIRRWPFKLTHFFRSARDLLANFYCYFEKFEYFEVKFAALIDESFEKWSLRNLETMLNDQTLTKITKYFPFKVLFNHLRHS